MAAMSLRFKPLELLPGEPWCGQCQSGWLPVVEKVTSYISAGRKTELLKMDPAYGVPKTEETDNAVVRYYSAVTLCPCRVRLESESAMRQAKELKKRNRQSGVRVVMDDGPGLLPKGE